ncbi:MAG: hypothetical protein CMP11_05700 [Zetaproteobacteria bacterium]|nr:hypothetical protein [Pseudobdellovibrionaceae bacterium]
MSILSFRVKAFSKFKKQKAKSKKEDVLILKKFVRKRGLEFFSFPNYEKNPPEDMKDFILSDRITTR